MGRKVPFWCSVRLQGRLLLPFSDSLKANFRETPERELRLIGFPRSSLWEVRKSDVLPTLLAGLLVLEPVLVLLAIGHGGSFEVLGLLL
jgi:hypothetical protein